MKIDLISDLHGFKPVLEGGDLLIIAGDLTARDKAPEYHDFLRWLSRLDYKKKLIIGGNHDTYLMKWESHKLCDSIEYLFDSGTEYEGLKIWGSPWTATFRGQNPECMAFSLDIDTQLMEKWALIPDDIDILVTHTPPQGVLDKCSRRRVGCHHLLNRVLEIKPKIHVFGHIHECGGQQTKIEGLDTTFVNAAYVNKYYEPVHKAIRIEL
jgi:Icc-related predicted phosphoesterase